MVLEPKYLFMFVYSRYYGSQAVPTLCRLTFFFFFLLPFHFLFLFLFSYSFYLDFFFFFFFLLSVCLSRFAAGSCLSICLSVRLDCLSVCLSVLSRPQSQELLIEVAGS